MPCNGVAVTTAKIAVTIPEMMKVPGAIDALTALLQQNHVVNRVDLNAYGITIDLRSDYVSIDNAGRVSANDIRTRDQVKEAVEQLSALLIVQIAAIKIRETARVRNETYLDSGALVMSVEI